MEVFGNDWILGNFQASNFGLILASFSYNGESEDELGFKLSTSEEFIGNKPVPIYLGDKYDDKLRPQITLCKNSDIYSQEDLYFSEKNCRWILRELTGIRGYQWMKIIDSRETEETWFKSKVVNISYKRVGGNVVGFIVELECDSCYGYSKIFTTKINAKANVPFKLFNNSDDLTNYVLPTVTIRTASSGIFTICNQSDNNWTTEISNLKVNESIIMNSEYEILSSSEPSHSLLLNDFNLHFIRLVPNENIFITNSDAIITLKYRVPRKVGFRW